MYEFKQEMFCPLINDDCRETCVFKWGYSSGACAIVEIAQGMETLRDIRDATEEIAAKGGKNG